MASATSMRMKVCFAPAFARDARLAASPQRNSNDCGSPSSRSCERQSLSAARLSPTMWMLPEKKDFSSWSIKSISAPASPVWSAEHRFAAFSSPAAAPTSARTASTEAEFKRIAMRELPRSYHLRLSDSYPRTHSQRLANISGRISLDECFGDLLPIEKRTHVFQIADDLRISDEKRVSGTYASSASQIFRPSGVPLVYKTAFEVFPRISPDNSLERLTERSVGLVTDRPSNIDELLVTLLQ